MNINGICFKGSIKSTQTSLLKDIPKTQPIDSETSTSSSNQNDNIGGSNLYDNLDGIFEQPIKQINIGGTNPNQNQNQNPIGVSFY